MRRGTYQPTTFLAVVLLLLILFVSAAYFVFIPQPDSSQQSVAMLAELRANQNTWESSRPLFYRYVVHRSCYCGPVVVTPYIATEERGLKSAEFRTEVESGFGDFLSAPPDPVWISDIFDELIEAMESDAGPVIEVTYDERYGYPVLADIRYPQPDATMRYEIRDFEVLEHR
jgi:uncharacterized protein DUF6174